MRMAMAMTVALGVACAAATGSWGMGYEGERMALEAPPLRVVPDLRAIERARMERRRLIVSNMQLVDRDGDGVVTAAEARQHYKWLFAFLDRDHDGEVTRPEFVRTLRPRKPLMNVSLDDQAERVERLFGRLDLDRDERLQVEEFMAAGRAHFAGCDADGDGTVTLQEFRSRRAL